MVDKSEIFSSNEQIGKQHLGGRVAVFMGATSGIGESTLNQMVTMLDDSTFYVLGQNQADIASKLEQLRAAASKRGNRVVFIETQVSYIANIDNACDQILAVETKVDYLCMSSGGMPFGGAIYTGEGLETCFAISYYSRLRMVFRLLPLLRRCPRARVLSILNGTLEKAIQEDDLGLEKNWGIAAVVNHTTVCTSLAFDYLDQHDEEHKIIYLHATPGFVSTNTPRKIRPSMNSGLFRWLVISVMQVISGWFIYYCGMNLGESGQRHSYHLTSGNFLPGSWQINRHSSVVLPNRVLKGYQDKGLAEKVWDHSLRTWDKALTSGGSL